MTQEEMDNLTNQISNQLVELGALAVAANNAGINVSQIIEPIIDEILDLYDYEAEFASRNFMAWGG